MRIYVRYDTPCEQYENKTRRDHYQRMGLPEGMTEVPEFVVPENGFQLWDMYQDLNASITRIHDGFCCNINPSEYLAFAQLSGWILSPYEFDILRAMDVEYCSEVNKELADSRERSADQQRKEADRIGRRK